MTFCRAGLALLAALFLLALPTAASAAVTVNSTADEPDAAEGLPCQTAAGKCTLPAAIEVTNSIGSTNIIDFDAAVFQGQLVDTIALATPLPPIEVQLNVMGGTCMTEAGVLGPCVGVSAPVGSFGITVDKEGVTITGLSVTGALTGISVINGAAGFTALGNWVGVKLDGSAGANNTGIFIDPNSDAATIGGTEPGQRNVIAGNNLEGLDIEGASDAVVRGNYFGVAPDGTTQMANAKNIEITDSTAGAGFKAENNEVGATIAEPALANDACDGGCNVISGSLGTGIDLQGSSGGNEAPATGPTVVHGNFVGLDATGADTVANAGTGVLAGGAHDVTVGGFAAGDRNYIVGGFEGIVSLSDGEGFEALGNSIGFGSDGSEQSPPQGEGILALNLDVSEDSKIESNKIRMSSGVGIETRFLTGRVIGNEVEGGNVGIRTLVGSGDGLIAGNEVEAPLEAGILVESPDNDIRGNSVFDSEGPGIKVRNPPGIAMTGNTVGGSNEDGENVLGGNAGPAIVVLEEALEPGSATEITRNRGSLNGGPFISLLAGANGGIKPPAVSTALQSSATGTAQPGATIRVFSKAGPEAGELGGFLAEAVADGSGNWKATFSSVPAGTLVTATQTVAGATSQLAGALAAQSESSGGGGGGCDDTLPAGQCAAPEIPKPPVQPPAPTPDTKITKAPKAKSSATTAKFKFNSTVAGASFECKLDKGKFKKCKSPKTYKKLKPGKHVFKVRAVGPTGLVDATPAKRKFTVLS